MSVDRMDSVWIGKDNALLDAMFEFYAPSASIIIDVCCNKKRMWKNSSIGNKVIGYDVDQEVQPDVVCKWSSLPNPGQSVDVLVYDPPHLPTAAASPKSDKRFADSFGLKHSSSEDNIQELHSSFLQEAKRVLKFDGLIFAKIKDYIHNHKYQWNLEYFNTEVRAAGLMPCDLIIKRDPCGGNMKSGRWKKAHHAKNVHCYWAVIRNSQRCEARN